MLDTITRRNTDNTLLKQITLVLGLYVAAGGLISFLGWAANIPRLTAWDNSAISIQPNTTVAAMSTGLALLALGLGYRRLAAAAGMFAGLLGAATIFEYVTGIDLGIDTVLMFGRTFGQQGVLKPGRMGPPGSISWTLIGTALLLASGNARRRAAAARVALVVMTIAALSIIGYLFGADTLYSLPRVTIIAFQTSTMIFAAAIGILVSLPECQPMRGLLQPGAAGDLRRRVLPAVIVIPVVLGFLRLMGQNAELYDTAMGTAILVLVLVALLCILLWRAADAVRLHELRAAASARRVSRNAANLRDLDRRKDEFLAMLAHELRNPLAAIRNAARVLSLVGSNEPRLVQLSNLVDRQTGQLARLVDDLLDVSRITTGHITLRQEPVLLQSVLSAAEEVVRPLIGQMGHTFTVSPAQEPIRLNGDFVRLVQVVGNLLTNAAKFTPPGGMITLTAEQVGELATIRVRDNGVGIPPERQRDVFKLFYQEESGLARTRGGLGIGLTLVKRLVELHGGEVSVRSEGEGRGSEFLITLPAQALSTPPHRLPGAAAPRRLTAGGKPLRILLIDDNVDAAASFGLLLELGGHQVAIAHDSNAALEVVQILSPEIAFVDIGLPDVDGYQLAALLRAHPGCEGTVFVALTGYGSDGDKARAAAAGFDHHLTKPADADIVDRLLTNVSEATGPRLEDRGNVH